MPFPGGGTIDKFYYNGFLTIWNAGIRDAYFAAKNKYPTYELWVVGTSMGGSLAGTAAAYISQMGYVNPSMLKLITNGMLRIGKTDLISRFPTLVPYAYRIVHRHDIVPHLIPLTAGYQHFGPEVSWISCLHFLSCDSTSYSTLSALIMGGLGNLPPR